MTDGAERGPSHFRDDGRSFYVRIGRLHRNYFDFLHLDLGTSLTFQLKRSLNFQVNIRQPIARDTFFQGVVDIPFFPVVEGAIDIASAIPGSTRLILPDPKPIFARKDQEFKSRPPAPEKGQMFLYRPGFGTESPADEPVLLSPKTYPGGKCDC